MNGRNIRVAAIHVPPFGIINKNSSGHIVSYTGMAGNLLEYLAKDLHFSYELVEASSYGYVSNGSVNGVVASLANDEVDLAAMLLSITQARFQYIDFLTPFLVETYGLTYNKRALGKTWGHFDFISMPFNAGSWKAIGLTIFLLPAIFCFLSSLSLHQADRNLSSGSISHISSGGNKRRWIRAYAVFLQECVMMLLKQSTSYQPTSISIRLFVGAYWLMSIVLTTYYTASFTAIFTAPVPLALPANTLQDLASAIPHSLTPIVLDNSAVLNLLQHQGHAGEKILEEIKKSERGRASNNELMLSRVLTSTDTEYVMLTPTKTVKNRNYEDYINTDKCHFVTSDIIWAREWVSFGIQKNSDFKDILDFSILHLESTGIIRKWIRDSIPENTPCNTLADISVEVSNEQKQQHNGQTVLMLRDFLGLFVAWSSGSIVAFIFFFIEQCVYKVLYHNV